MKYFLFFTLFTATTQCKTYNKYFEICDNHKIINAKGIYQFILSKVTDTDIVLDEILYITQSDTFSIGSLSSLSYTCDKIKRMSKYKNRRDIYESKEHPILIPHQISKLKNAYYNKDSTQIIVSLYAELELLVFDTPFNKELEHHIMIATYKGMTLLRHRIETPAYILNFRNERKLNEFEMKKLGLIELNDIKEVIYSVIE